MIKHTVRLEGENAQGNRVPFQVLSDLLEALLQSAQRSLRLRVDGRSSLHGHPAWLDDATRFDFTGLTEGSTVVNIEAPPLGEAVPQIFDRLPLWDSAPRRDQTALSLVEDAARDAIAGNSESDLLDRNILESLSHFGKILSHGYEAITLNGGTAGATPVRMTCPDIQTAERLHHDAPAPERTIVAGYLDELKHSKRAFSLILSDGHSLKGLLPQGDPSAYANLWGKRVVVDGEVTFKPSRAVSLILAENIELATDTDKAWDRVPVPHLISLDELKPRIAPKPGTSGMDKVFGRWPGDETTEQIEHALSEIG
ncbi:MAG: hypothetical protein Q7T82_10970 [Armatimonadota bacterium]|nr:hypothetical protein [Armatimonadota bacterium]